MINKVNKVHEVLKLSDHQVYHNMGDYTQFTIDFFEQAEDAIQDKVDNEEGFSDDYIGSIIYRIDCILYIAKEGKDKELFTEVKNKLEELEK